MRYGLPFACLLLVVMSFTACYYDVEEELYPTVACDTAMVNYSQTVMGIISQHCYSCHDANANFGGVTLEGYAALMTYVDNGALLGVIEHEAGFSPMPKNQAQLVACDIEKIKVWISAGALNN